LCSLAFNVKTASFNNSKPPQAGFDSRSFQLHIPSMILASRSANVETTCNGRSVAVLRQICSVRQYCVTNACRIANFNLNSIMAKWRWHASKRTCCANCNRFWIIHGFMATLTYRCFHGSAPSYLSTSIHCVADVPSCRRQRSASTETLVVHQTRFSV